MRKFSKLFKALSDSNRLRILKMLEVKPMCVCEIQAVLGLAVSTVSKHLSLLRDAGYIYDVKENKWVTYHLNESAPDDMVRTMLAVMRTAMTAEDQVLKDRCRAQKADRNKLCRNLSGVKS